MVLSSESLVTDVAGVGSFVRVCTLVYEKVVRFAELSPTKAADVLLLGSFCSTT